MRGDPMRIFERVFDLGGEQEWNAEQHVEKIIGRFRRHIKDLRSRKSARFTKSRYCLSMSG
jgi:hypothetical protein